MRIVVFTCVPSFPVRAGIVAIDEAIAGLEWLVLVHVPRRRPAALLRNQWRNLRRNGWRWLPYQAGNVIRQVAGRRLAARAHRGEYGTRYSLDALSNRGSIRIQRVNDINADAVVGEVREF